MFSTQKSPITLLFIDFDFFPDLQGPFGWFVNFLLYGITVQNGQNNMQGLKECICQRMFRVDWKFCPQDITIWHHSSMKPRDAKQLPLRLKFFNRKHVLVSIIQDFWIQTLHNSKILFHVKTSPEKASTYIGFTSHLPLLLLWWDWCSDPHLASTPGP